MSTAPAVTVSMPVYNGAEFLGQAIESILDQTFKDYEFLIINDGSSDNSLKIIKDYAAKDARIKVISQPNAGIVAALNKGLKASRGKYIARMDADDIALPTRLEKQLKFLTDNPSCAVVGSSFISIYNEGKLGGTHHCFVNDQTIRHALSVEGCIPHPTAFYKKAAVLKAGGYRKAYLHAEDYDLWRRLAAVGQLANLAEPLLRYRHISTSVTYSNSKPQADTTSRIRREVWQDKELSEFKKISVGLLKKLPGEDLSSLKKLQRRLLVRSLEERDFNLFRFFLWDIIKAGF